MEKYESGLIYSPLSLSARLRNCLTHIYSSYKIRYLYIIIILLSLCDFISACVFWPSYSNHLWVIWLDVVLNFLLIIDSFIRIFIRKITSCRDMKKAWIELLMITFCVPELVLTLLLLYADEYIYSVPKLFSVILTFILLILRPVIFYVFRKDSIISSIRLPNSVVTHSNVIHASYNARMDTGG